MIGDRTPYAKRSRRHLDWLLQTLDAFFPFPIVYSLFGRLLSLERCFQSYRSGLLHPSRVHMDVHTVQRLRRSMSRMTNCSIFVVIRSLDLVGEASLRSSYKSYPMLVVSSLLVAFCVVQYAHGEINNCYQALEADSL